jgi:hypothetical protein
MPKADAVFDENIDKRSRNEYEDRLYKRLREDKIDTKKEQLEKNDKLKNVENYILRGLGNDIAPIPDVKEPERRQECSTSFKLFCEHYFPNRFFLRWSQTHIDSLQLMQDAVTNGGGYYALAEPRGGGKSARAEVLALWALLNGYRKFVVCVGATAGSSVEMYKSILTEIETNALLMADYPEVCYPIQCLNGSYMRARSQHCASVQTRLEVRADSLVLPYVEDENGIPVKTSGSAIQCVSITGRIRGIKRTVVNTGTILRPDFVIIDDPQTDRSAKSPKQVDTRERTIVGTICGLAGPQSSITAVMPCTVIQSNDLAERFLDHEKRPEWQGTRTAMLLSFPTNLDLWKEYAEIQAQSFRDGTRGTVATEFYAANRAAMDEGAEVSWTERYNPKVELSAIQHAMNLWIKDPKAFAAEYQNKPLIESNGQGDKIEIHAKDVIQRVSGHPFGVVPRETEYLTSGIDIQQKIIYYCTTAWSRDFGGVIVDYGTCPRQTGTDYFVADNPTVTLDSMFEGLLLGPQIYAALEFLRDNTFKREFERDEGLDTLKIQRCLIDANWNLSADAVYAFCKENESVFHPSHGKGITASQLPMDQWQRKQGEPKPGKGWRIKLNTVSAGRGRHTLYDTNFWKSRIAERLIVPKGSGNCLLLWGSKVYQHQLLSDHLSCEHSFAMEGRGRKVHQWEKKPGNSENHWFDCLVQSAVAASQLGLDLHDITTVVDGSTESSAIPKRVRPRINLSDYGKK